MFRDNGSVPIARRIFESPFVGIVRAIFEMEWNANIVPAGANATIRERLNKIVAIQHWRRNV